MRLLYFAALLVLSICPSAAQECSPDSMVYRLDQRNLTGWRHDLTRGEIVETAHFENIGQTLVITTPEDERRYWTTSGGTGIQFRVAIPNDGDDDGRLTYQFYDIASRVGEGRGSIFLLIDGDLYWPDC